MVYYHYHYAVVTMDEAVVTMDEAVVTVDEAVLTVDEAVLTVDEAVVTMDDDANVPVSALLIISEVGTNLDAFEVKLTGVVIDRLGRLAVKVVEAIVVSDVTHILGLKDKFWHLPRRPGKQLSQILPSFEQEQLQLPVLLQRQQVIFP